MDNGTTEEMEVERKALEYIGETNLQVIKKQELDRENEDEFAIGNHVYKWCSLVGIPGMFQHHGIVIEVKDGRMTIADFSAMISKSTHTSNEPCKEDELESTPTHTRTQKPPKSTNRLIAPPRFSANDAMVDYTVEESMEVTRWRKVKYEATWLCRSFQRSGTCTIVKADPPGLVLSRVKFLMERQEGSSSSLPPYNWLKANCECVAVWCKTALWATLQASSFLEVTTAGQVKSTVTLAAYASSQTVTVPAAGIWGSWFGKTKTVSLLAIHPHFVPMLAGYGLLTVGGPCWILYRCKHAWNDTTTRLNDEFWSNAMDRPKEFATCITHWSEAC